MKTRVMTFNIVVDLEPVAMVVNANKSTDDFLMDIGTLEDYNDFTASVELLLEDRGFIIDKKYNSNRPNSLSFYITCHREDEDDGSTIKCVFYIRISDHRLSDEDQKIQKAYWNGERERLSDKLKRRIAVWRPKTIIVNNVPFESYDDVLRDVANKIDTWRA